MKKFLPVCLAASLFLPFLAAQPAVGTWTSQDGAFPPGEWQELLYGGGEGQPGNEIQASSTGYYALSGATILNAADVVQLQACEPVEEGGETLYPDFIYQTVYSGGTLELVNSGTPWGSADPSGTFVVSLGPLVNVTTKFTGDASCDPTGEISFELSGVGTIEGYEGYHVFIRARYTGTPTLSGSDPQTLAGTFEENGFVSLSISPPAALDIKPGSCVNPFNVRTRGVLPVALLGSDLVDVSKIDPSSILLEGVPPLRWAFEDVAGPGDCGGEASDGYMDLVLKFSSREILTALGEVANGDEILLTLTADLDVSSDDDGGDVSVPLIAQDFVTIIDTGNGGSGSPDGADNGNHYGADNGNQGQGDNGNHYGADNGSQGQGDNGNHYGADNGNQGQGDNGNHYGADNGNHGEGNNGNHYGQDNGNAGGNASEPGATSNGGANGNKNAKGSNNGNNGRGGGGNG